jgi:hypothetical protein
MEKTVNEAIRAGTLRGSETLKARATLSIDGLPMKMTVEDDIPLG